METKIDETVLPPTFTCYSDALTYLDHRRARFIELIPVKDREPSERYALRDGSTVVLSACVKPGSLAWLLTFEG